MNKNINYWYLSSFLVSLLVAIPILTVFASFFGTIGGYYELLRNTFLISYIINSALILIGVLFFTFIFGVLSAYLVSFYKFPGVNFFKWALILSFAVPAYIYAYSLTAFFENFGTLFSILTWLFGDGEYNKYIPKFDGMIGAILAMSFSLFGYVYVLTRASFFSVSTLTTGIYNAWLAFDDLNTANQLSFILLLIIFVIFFIENYSRGAAKYHHSSQGFKKIPKIRLKGKTSFFATFFCSIIFFLSFVFPTAQMFYWTVKFPKYFKDIDLLTLNLNTLLLVFLASACLIILSFLINFGNRVSKSKILDYLSLFSISGYALPGVILAVGFITFFSWFSDLISNLFGVASFKSIFIGSILGLIITYFVRFYSLAFNGIKSNYLKINQSIDESSYLLGFSKFKTLKKIHFPHLKNSIFLISILIAIEIIKELPITLILRPFNFETFATKAYGYASQDLLEAAALPSLFLIFWAGVLIFITSKHILSEK